MSKHLNNYKNILANLQILEIDLNDEDKGLLLLNPLPGTFHHLITMFCGKDEVMSHALTNK